MLQVSPDSYPRRDLAGLRLFLEDCRHQAVKRARPQLVSISLPVRHIAPLAVLDSIFEPRERHFYLERPAADEAIAGAEAVVEAAFSGPERFASVRGFAQDTLANTIAFGDLDYPFAGPHFLCGFTFADQVEEDSRFRPASVFVPRWQVSRREGRFGAVANLMVGPESNLDNLAGRVWAAHQKFADFDYEEANPSLPATNGSVRVLQAMGRDRFQDGVMEALRQIESGLFEKIVLARTLDLESEQPFAPLAALNRLREDFSGCYAFSYGDGAGRSFIGATPERLVRLEAGRLLTMALAGTVRRGESAREDAGLGRVLLESEKDRREHQVVIDAIIRRLGKLGLKPDVVSPPALLQLANVQHLLSPITAEVAPGVHLLDLLEVLHPTPAVGGSPRAVTTRRIAEVEGFDRGLYAGAVGWFDAKGEGEMVVAIRSALIDGTRARLFAGSGIVKGSDPARERHETDWKLQALFDALRGGPEASS